MAQPFKDAISICKTLMRNGYDAYIVNARLQSLTIDETEQGKDLDICSELDFDGLFRLFPNIQPSKDAAVIGTLKQGQSTYYFYPADVSDASHPEETVAKLTPRLMKKLEQTGEIPLSRACPYVPKAKDMYEDLADFSEGKIRLRGVPDQTLRRDYLTAVRILRFAANFHLPIGQNTWMSIVRNSKRVLDYVSTKDIMDEWRKVEAENMHVFLKLMFDSQLLHGFMPEIAALSRVKHIKNQEEGEEDVLTHTMDVMSHYPEELPYDWYGTMACMFHDVGKLFTAEYYDGNWSFYQHHRVGAKVTRKILTRLGLPMEDVDLICLLVRNHMRLHFMLTDKGIKKFKALDEYPRLIEMVRADIKARGGNYREFNHNMKMLERADIPEEALTPFLNGVEIMQSTGLKPGPAVGILRDQLLRAQIAGDVANEEEAIKFVKDYKRREKL